MPPAKKRAAVPTVAKGTGRRHASGTEASLGGLLLVARTVGAISDVRGLDRGDPQESFALDVYGSKQVEALLLEVEKRTDKPCCLPLARLCQDVRRSRVRCGRYLADFTYTSQDTAWGPVGERVVLDAKGGWRDPRRNSQYRIFLMKKALMLAAHSVEVVEMDGKGNRLK